MDSAHPSRVASPLDPATDLSEDTRPNPRNVSGVGFTGDVMLGRGVGAQTRPEQLALALDRLRGPRDLIVNLECCVTDAAGTAAHAHSAFSGSRDLLACLPAAGVRAANVANNHALDFGEKGLRDTLDALDEFGISVLGWRRPGDLVAPFRVAVGDRRLSVFGCCDLTLPSRFWRAGLLRADEPDLHAAVRTAVESGDTVVVSVHWGHEMITVPTPESRDLARRFAEMGVRCVIGHGPHVVQGHERLASCDVFYSLGDAVFDRSDVEHRNWGLAVYMDAASDGLRLSREIVTIQRDTHTPLVTPESPFERAWKDRVGVLTSDGSYRARFAREAGSGFLGRQLRETLRLVRRNGFGGFLVKLRGLRLRHFKLLVYSLRRGKRDASASR